MTDAGRQSVAEREHAVQRLDAAIEVQSRVRGERDCAQGTAEEAAAKASLRAVDDVVVARERWLKAVDDHDY